MRFLFHTYTFYEFGAAIHDFDGVGLQHCCFGNDIVNVLLPILYVPHIVGISRKALQNTEI